MIPKAPFSMAILVKRRVPISVKITFPLTESGSNSSIELIQITSAFKPFSDVDAEFK